MPPRTRARTSPAATRGAAGGGAAASPLGEADIAALQQRLETGGRPRVMLLVDTALGAAGTTVPVVGFGDPADGEFISVRLRDDVVPFAPSELALPTRGRPAGRSVEAAAIPPAALPLEPPVEAGAAARGAAAPATKPRETPRAGRPGRLKAVPDIPVAADESVPTLPTDARPAATEPVKATEPAKAAEPVTATPPAAPGKRAGRPARSGSLAITLRFTGASWTYETTRSGKRSAAKPLNLAAVRAFADRLDDPTLRRDLQAAVDLCRQQVQTRAQALRAELEQVETELAELED